jgi:hypothetical protein
VNATAADGREWGAAEYSAWQQARLQSAEGFRGFRERGQVGEKPIVFGVLSDRLVGRPGGVFFGLIKEREKDIRPTFLGQTDFVGFSIDLASTVRMRPTPYTLHPSPFTLHLTLRPTPHTLHPSAYTLHPTP